MDEGSEFYRFKFPPFFLNLINTNTCFKKIAICKKKKNIWSIYSFCFLIKVSLFDDEASYEAFDMKIIFHYHASKTHFL